MGTAISGKFDLNEAFWQKMEKINQRKSFTNTTWAVNC
jgi:predicted DNA-binding ribbon-helix-helix protein